MNDLKTAATKHGVHALITGRWSPYAFADRPVADADRLAVFEAAGWAASAFNEQPWRFIVATREDPAGFERLLSCLVEANQAWAKHVPVLALGVASLRFERNGTANGTAHHDLGLAAANLTVEATARGLAVHQMSGILPDRARELYGIPDGFDPLTAIAIGYAADPADVPESLRERDLSPRSRRPLGETVFAGRWGAPAV